ncbi:hypothetical protein SAMN05192575_101482 [Nocardioides alpinus]|uniref:Uncharacterized protein n=1 Tax=Nocardioides alpinus TaxID=748909 RepID=A0A1I0VVR9_9ACTN|nr:hypothetical protein [Nocardioides alpinus]PKH37498.1 hypothetical protein CXG46_18810 [Nocardioides alpinus]SFA80147.1 hypothetical protein SAMN05192575_101482 [Nocardioides alpinus]
MSDDETQPVRPEGAALPPAPETAYAADPEPAPVSRRGFRERLRTLRGSGGDRSFGLAALLASALAGIIVGGLGFAAVHAVTDDGPRDRGGWTQQRDGDEGPGRGGMHGGPRGVPGQLPPTTAPEDDDSAG